MTDILHAADAGTWREIDGEYELRFERRLRHSPERVWAALTTPEGLTCWLADAIIELKPGGRMDMHWSQPDDPQFPIEHDRDQANLVLRVDAPRLFEHTFDGTSRVLWELHPDGDGTHLVLTHRMAGTPKDLSMTLSGWHHHLDGLDDAVRGVKHGWSWARWRALDAAYAAEIAL